VPDLPQQHDWKIHAPVQPRKLVAVELDTARLVQEEREVTVIVLDAAAAIDWLLQKSAEQRIEKRIYSHTESAKQRGVKRSRDALGRSSL
jgi:hypothetical protein